MFTRRAILHKCLAVGSLTVASSFSAERMLAAFQDREKQLRKPTPPNSLGPFYKKLAPTTATLRSPGDPGLPLSLSGRVLDTRGDVLTDAIIEIWQTDHFGYYDLDGYRYRGRLPVMPRASTKSRPSCPDIIPTSVAFASMSTIW
jgi:protocatechuate 3,4-dioxygenase beta subunit